MYLHLKNIRHANYKNWLSTSLHLFLISPPSTTLFIAYALCYYVTTIHQWFSGYKKCASSTLQLFFNKNNLIILKNKKKVKISYHKQLRGNVEKEITKLFTPSLTRTDKNSIFFFFSFKKYYFLKDSFSLSENADLRLQLGLIK